MHTPGVVHNSPASEGRLRYDPGVKALVLLLAAAVLVGCGGDGPAAAPVSLPPLPEVVSPPSVTPTATPPPVVLPPRPPELNAATDLGAAASARYWIEAIAAAQAAVDPSGLVALSDPGCRACQRYIKAIGEAATVGRSYRGGKVRIRESVSAPVEGESASVLLNYDVTQVDVLDSTGMLVISVAGADNIALTFTMLRTGGSWVVADVVDS